MSALEPICIDESTRSAGRGHPPTVVAIAWPTGRPIYQYTAEQLAAGVDLFTIAMKTRAANIRAGRDAQ